VSNIFQYTGITYAQFPEDLVDSKLKHLRFNSVKLYLLVLRRAQQKSSPTVKIQTREAVEILGLPKNSHGPARAELSQYRLVASTEINNQGWWSYQLLNPSTGDLIPDPRSLVDFDKLTPGELKQYYLHHLTSYDAKEVKNGLSSRCPFHQTAKARQTPFSVQLSEGGPWHCFRCNKSGKLVEFEKEIALRSGRPITSRQAYNRIRSIAKRPVPTPWDDADGPRPTI
jgi:hypothetical protein